VGAEGSAVAIGIDAAVVADHHVMVRQRDAQGPGTVLEEFTVAPTLVGMERLAKKLSAYPGAVAVAEPTSMTWLPLALALDEAGCSFALVGNRHAGRLRGALAGKNKSDVIDAEVLSRAGELFTLSQARIPDAAELALRRAVLLRDKAVLDANRARRRLFAQARWAYPDVWIAFGRSWATALAVLGRWPHLGSLARARVSTLTDVVAAHTRSVAGAGQRAERIRAAAHGWVAFWEGHLDLDALGWETAQLLVDVHTGDERRSRAELEAMARWESLWGDDPLLLSVPGMGLRVAPVVRAFWGDGRQFAEADQAQRRREPLQLVERRDGTALPRHHQGGTGGAASRLLPGRQRCPNPRPAARGVLSQADGAARPLSRPGQLCRRPQAGGPHLDHDHHRLPL
jgi:hypothetical protein